MEKHPDGSVTLEDPWEAKTLREGLWYVPGAEKYFPGTKDVARRAKNMIEYYQPVRLSADETQIVIRALSYVVSAKDRLRELHGHIAGTKRSLNYVEKLLGSLTQETDLQVQTKAITPPPTTRFPS